MTRQGRHSAPSLLHTAEQARSGARRRVAGSVPEWALPHCGTLGRHVSHRSRTSALPACAGFGAQAASKVTAVAFAPRDVATHQWMKMDLKTDGSGISLRHSAIAICIAHVLNSSGAPIASLTSKLTRHERGPNRGPNEWRVCTETRCRTSDGRERAGASGVCRHGHSRWQVVTTAWWIADANSARIATRGPRAQPGTTLASGCCGADRAELRGLAPSCRAPLS